MLSGGRTQLEPGLSCEGDTESLSQVRRSNTPLLTQEMGGGPPKGTPLDVRVRGGGAEGWAVA